MHILSVGKFLEVSIYYPWSLKDVLLNFLGFRNNKCYNYHFNESHVCMWLNEQVHLWIICSIDGDNLTLTDKFEFMLKLFEGKMH